MLNVSSWSIRNPIPAVMLFVLLTVAGLIAFGSMKVQNFPDLDVPTISVTASLPGVAPSQLETDVARKLENALAPLQGLKHITTKVQDGVVSITAEFRMEKPTQEAVDDVRSAIQGVRADLPGDLRDPVVQKLNLAGTPVLAYTVRSGRMDDEALSWLVDKDITRKLLSLRGVGAVNRVGGVTREVRIALDVNRLQSLGITVSGELAVDPATGLIDKVTGSEILGFSTNDPDKFSGVSAWRVTYIVDEASGVAEPIFKAMKGNMAGGARLILFSNPTQPSGTFYDSHNDSSELYRTFHFDSARVAIALVRREIRGPVGLEAEGLAQTSWVRDMLTEFGADSAEFAVRVRGAFPAEGSDGIVPLAVVQQSMGLWNESDVMRHINERLVCGLDVARFGDDESVLIGRRSTHVLAPTSWRNMDSIALADAVAAEVATWTTPGESTFRKRPLIIADEGGPGSGVCDQLAKRHSKELEVMPVNFGSRADDRTKYVNKRTQLWFGIRHFLKNGGKLPRHRDLRTDLTSVRYGYDKENRWQAEPKKDVKKRLGRSPDYGSAYVLALLDTPKRAVVAAMGQKRRREYDPYSLR